ncbi:MAG TPA: hypothetical protein VF469_22325, partial [Kofleriaceae bacterium]
WGDTAVYVPPTEPGALGFALGTLIRDPLARGARGALARARAMRLTSGRMAAAYVAVYEDEIARRPFRREAMA